MDWPNNIRATGDGIKPAEPYEKSYLSGAIFLAGLEGDRDLLVRLQDALHNPARALFLGRKSCVPAMPIWLPDGIVEKNLERALRDYPWLVHNQTTLLDMVK